MLLIVYKDLGIWGPLFLWFFICFLKKCAIPTLICKALFMIFEILTLFIIGTVVWKMGEKDVLPVLVRDFGLFIVFLLGLPYLGFHKLSYFCAFLGTLIVGLCSVNAC